MKQAVWAGICVGIMIGVFLFIGVVETTPPHGITPDRLRGCQLAGYRGIVIDSFSVIYCTNYTDFVPWVE